MRRVLNMPFRNLLSIQTALFLFFITGYSQNFDDVQIKPEKVSEGIYALFGAGGNIGVCAGDDGVFMIDDQFAPLTEKIKAAISEISTKDIRFLLNTHLHGDHTGGNENFGKAGVAIVAHENVRQRMSREEFNRFSNRTRPASPKAALPIVTFTQDITFHLNGEEIYVFHLHNAHTDGDAVVQFKNANVIHTGDLFFVNRYPYIDVASGGSVQGLIKAVNHILGMIDDETKIIPGHGPVTDKSSLTTYRDVLVTVSESIEEMVKAGKTLEEITAAKPGEKYDSDWGGGFVNPERFVASIYHSLVSDTK